MTKKIILIFGLTLFAVSQSCQPANSAVQLPKENILYHFSFDNESLLPDIGEVKIVRQIEQKQFLPGRSGKGFLIRGGKGGYNVDYSTKDHLWAEEGSLSFWVKPVSWFDPREVDERGYIVLFRMGFASVGKFLIERQGVRKGLPKRNDLLIIGVFSVPDFKDNPSLYPASTLKWVNNRWHFIVVNWDRKGIAASVDAKKFRSVEFPRALTAKECPTDKQCLFQIGGGNADPAETTLIDELTIYKRQLRIEEVRKLFGQDDDDDE